MKTLLIAGFLGYAVFLTGCETTVVDRRHDQGGYGYSDNGRYGDGGARYHTQNVERTTVYQNNVHETNTHRSDTNRTVVKTRAQGGQAAASKRISQGSQAQANTRVNQSSPKKIKAKAGVQNGNAQDKKNDSDAQTHQ